jgi:hypothetical protein
MCNNSKSNAPEIDVLLRAEYNGGQDQHPSTLGCTSPTTLPRRASCGDGNAWPGTGERTGTRPDIQLPLHAQCFPGGIPPKLKLSDESRGESSISQRRARSSPSPRPLLTRPRSRAPRESQGISTRRAPGIRLGHIRDHNDGDGPTRFEPAELQRSRSQNINHRYSKYGIHLAGFKYCDSPGCEYRRPGDGFRHCGLHEIDRETLFGNTDEEFTIIHPVPEVLLETWNSESLQIVSRAIQDVLTRSLVFQSEIDEQQYEDELFTDREIDGFDRKRQQTLHNIQNVFRRKQNPNSSQSHGGIPRHVLHFDPREGVFLENEFEYVYPDQYGMFY